MKFMVPLVVLIVVGVMINRQVIFVPWRRSFQSCRSVLVKLPFSGVNFLILILILMTVSLSLEKPPFRPPRGQFPRFVLFRPLLPVQRVEITLLIPRNLLLFRFLR